MKRHWKKVAIAFISFAMVGLMTTSAMALILEARSEEMLANSTCDEAGTITIFFTAEDIGRINDHLNGITSSQPNNFASIRATLGGDNVALDASPPVLCKNIIGDNSALGFLGLPLPNSDPIPGDGQPRGLVALDKLTVEVSDKDGNNIPDVFAWVYGRANNQFFTIYITNFTFAPAADATQAQLPWIKVGLHEDVIPPDYESTSICANIQDFGVLAILDVSLDTEPNNLTINTSDNQIGHMLAGNLELRDCNEKSNEFCNLNEGTIGSTSEIVLAPLGEQGACATYYKCIVAEGTYPSSGTMKIIVRTNGASNGADVQKGVYLRGIILYDEQGSHLLNTGFEFFRADGETEVYPDPDSPTLGQTDALECTFRAQYAETEVQAGNLNGDEIRFCILYQVDPDEAEVDTDVQFWVDITTVPCGILLQDSIDAARLVKSAQRCIYFPYVLSGLSDLGWVAGVAVTNLSSDVALDDMEVTATLTDSTGTPFTGIIPEDIMTGTVFAFSIDQLATVMGWEVADGPAWLEISGNFAIDGYSFLTDGNFGAGTLPRLECISE